MPHLDLRRAFASLSAMVFLACGAAARAGEIVDAGYVADALARGAIVWDVRDATAYQQGHIPGAVNADVAALRAPNREDWLPAPQVSAALGKAGIDVVGREVIVYSTTGDPNAYYALGGIRYYGGKQGHVFHGGLDAWKADGRKVATEATTLPPVALTLTPVSNELIFNAEMMDRVKAGRTQLVDARTPKEFSGEDIRAIRGGHVPRAINLPYEQNWVDPQTSSKLATKQVTTRAGMSLKPADDLKTLYAGLDRDKEVVVYCQSGVRAQVTATVLRDLGFKDVKVYEPSWLGYAGVLSAPADDEVFLNVGALNGRIASLQGRVTELDAEVARLKEAAKK